MSTVLMPFGSNWDAIVDTNAGDRWYRSLMASVDTDMGRWLAPASVPLDDAQLAARAIARLELAAPEPHGPIELDDDADVQSLPGRGPALAKRAIALGFQVRAVVGLSGGRVHKVSQSLRVRWPHGTIAGYPRLFDLWIDRSHQYAGLIVAPGHRSQLTSAAFADMLETIGSALNICKQ